MLKKTKKILLLIAVMTCIINTISLGFMSIPESIARQKMYARKISILVLIFLIGFTILSRLIRKILKNRDNKITEKIRSDLNIINIGVLIISLLNILQIYESVISYTPGHILYNLVNSCGIQKGTFIILTMIIVLLIVLKNSIKLIITAIKSEDSKGKKIIGTIIESILMLSLVLTTTYIISLIVEWGYKF